MSHRLSITTLPSSSNGHTLAGKVDGLDDPKFHDFPAVGVIPYLWTLSSKHRGWHPATSSPIVVPPHGRWSIRIATGLQYAVLLVRSTFELTEPADGTLPLGAVIDGLFGSPLEVTILTAPDRRLTGLVSAWSPPAYRPDPTGSAPAPHWENLRLMAWARKNSESTAADDIRDNDVALDETTCEANGYWAFDEIPELYRQAKSYCVALVANEFHANGAPQEGDLGVRSVAWHDHMALPRTRGAGRRGS
jgi:hypothetical protein